MDAGPNRHERRRQMTRTRLLSTGQQLFDLHGYAGTSMALIAEAADVATTTVYSHFGSKTAIFFEQRCVWWRLSTSVVPAMLAAARAGDHPRDDRLVAELARLVEGHAAALAVGDLSRAARDVEDDIELQRWERDLQTAVEEQLADLLALRPGPVPSVVEQPWRTAALLVTEMRATLRDARRTGLGHAAAPVGRTPLRARLDHLLRAGDPSSATS